MTHADECALCGHPLTSHDRNVRFVQPDPVVGADGESSASAVWMSGADANSSVMMQVDGLGAFVRALLPVKLTGGYTITYGVWVGIDPSELRNVFDTWWAPTYKDLKLTGWLANSIEPWGLLGAPVRLEVLDADSTPYCLPSTDARLNGVLVSEWDHELMLSAIR